MNKIITLTGASGAGKTTITKELFGAIPGLNFVSSVNTRARRESDLDEDRYDVSLKEFESIKKNAEFLWTVEVHGYKKGTLKSALDKALSSNAMSLMMLVPEIIPVLTEYTKGNVIPFYILSPLNEILEKRFKKRGDSKEDTERRIADCNLWDEKARSSGTPYIFITNNGVVEEAVQQILLHINPA